MRIKATSEVEKSCSTSDMSSSDVEFDSSKGSVLNMRKPRVVAASSQPRSGSESMLAIIRQSASRTDSQQTMVLVECDIVEARHGESGRG